MAQTLWADLAAAFPWIKQLGLNMAWLQGVLSKSQSLDEVAAAIRGTNQYKKRFPGIYDLGTGEQIMSEAEYIGTEEAYRQNLRQFGHNVERDFSRPVDLLGWFAGRVDPNEQRDRLMIWRQVTSPGGQAFKDAFYVYSGKQMTDEELYQAGVDQAAAQHLSQNITAATAMNLDYATFIKRATEVGKKRVANELKRLQSMGVINAAAVQRILAIDPAFAEQMMDSIYTAGTGDFAQGIPLQDLLEAFDLAAIGATATEAGLVMPTKDRLVEFRNAGAEKAKMIQSYREFGLHGTALAAAVQRARGVGFTQRSFEQAEFLGSKPESQQMLSGIGYMEARGKDQGEFRFTEDAGRIKQLGFTNR